LREVKEFNGKEITYDVLYEISLMQEKAFPEGLQTLSYTCSPAAFSKLYQADLEDIHIVKGNDWYIIYNTTFKVQIWIYELARVEPPKGEKNLQFKEISKTLRKMLETEMIISGALLEDTAYPLFLIMKKRGVITQLGMDLRYCWKSKYFPTTPCDEQQQEKILQRRIRKNDPFQKFMAHQVSFRSSK